MKPINTGRKIFQKFRYGLVLQILRDRLLRYDIDITPYYWVRENAPDRPAPEIRGDFSGYTFGFFNPDDIQRIGSRPGSKDVPAEHLLARLEAGEKCFGAKNGGEIAAFTWIAFDECRDRLNPVKLKPNEVYLHDAYTMKPFRGQNLMSCLRVQIYEVLRGMGHDTFYSICVFFNRPAIRYMRKLNVKFLWLGLYINFFKKYKRHWILKKYPG